jgi:hypothetical protein
LSVELVYGPARDNDFVDAQVLPMQRMAEASADGRVAYSVDFTSPDSGLFAYGVRVRPQHPDLPNRFATYLTCWA